MKTTPAASPHAPSQTNPGEDRPPGSSPGYRQGAFPKHARALGGRLLAAGVGIVLTLTGCTATGSSTSSGSEEVDRWEPRIPAGDDTPFEQRQSLEDYAATVVPAILEFEERTTQAGSGEWRSNERVPFAHQFDVESCREGVSDTIDGEFMLRMVGAGTLPAETVQQLGEELFVPLGFQTEITEDAYGNHELTWTDWKNGGRLRAFVGQRVLTLAGFSECRPSNDWEQVRTEVQEIDPLRDGPLSRPSSPEPSPSRTRSLPRAAHRRAVSAPVKEPA